MICEFKSAGRRIILNEMFDEGLVFVSYTQIAGALDRMKPPPGTPDGFQCGSFSRYDKESK